MTIDEMLAAIDGSTLKLNDRGLTALPDDLSPLAGRVRRLELADNGLTALPESLGTLTRLSTLILTGNALATLPDTFGDLTALLTLDLRRNALRDLPPSLAACTRLHTLRMAANKMKGAPAVLWALPHLKTLDGLVGLGQRYGRRDARALYDALMSADCAPPVRQRAFDVARGQITDDVPPSQIAEVMAINHDGVRRGGLEALVARSDYAGHPVAAGSRVFVMGTIHSKKTELKARLVAVDATYATKIDDRVTHVVLGRKPKRWDGADRPGLVFCTEQQLVETLDQLDTPYLVEEVQESPDAADDVVEMLQSPDRDTVALGLDLVSAGGVPAAVQTALFYVGKGLGDKKLGAKARKLLKVHGSDAVRAALANRGKLFSVGHKGEKKTDEALGVFRRQAPDLDWGEIALLIKRDHGVGLRFVLDRMPAGHPTRLRALRLMVSDGTLDLYTHYAGYMPDFFNAYAYYGAGPMPPELYTFTELTGLDLRGCLYGELPEGISAIRGLRRLNLDGNQLTALPADFGDLAALEWLDLGCNRFETFPTAQIVRLKNLKTLRFMGNRGEGELRKKPAVLEVPTEVRAALPDCEFVDGPHRWQASYWENA